MKLKSRLLTASLAALICSGTATARPIHPGNHTLALIIDNAQTTSWSFDSHNTPCTASQKYGYSSGMTKVSCPAIANGELLFFHKEVFMGYVTIGNNPCAASAINQKITATAKPGVCVITIQSNNQKI